MIIIPSVEEICVETLILRRRVYKHHCAFNHINMFFAQAVLARSFSCILFPEREKGSLRVATALTEVEAPG